MARVVRLLNPAAFDQEEVRELFTKAFDKNPMATFADAESDLRASVTDPLIGLFIGAEKGKLMGLSIACLPRNALTPIPSVYRFYNSGSKRLLEALVKATVDFFLEVGYTRFWGINTTGGEDAAYMKLFKSAGEGTRIGSFLEFKIG